jgi:glycosyltransferase involved in cell wall biosynthesis
MYSSRFTLLPLYALNATNYKGRIIIAPRGMLHSGAMKRKSFKKRMFLKSLSYFHILKRAHFHATDVHEIKHICKYFKSPLVLTAPNIPNIDEEVWKERPKRPGIIRVIFVSRLHPHKNIDYALRAMRNISTDCSIEFNIFGSVDDANYYNKCKSIAAGLGNHITVNFKGPIHPNEIFDTLRKHHLFFLPTLGENFGHAIFESLSAGCPVLISDQTPWNGLEQANAGWALPLLKQDLFTSKIQEVCRMDEKEYNEVSLAAYSFAHAYFSKLDIEKGYSNLFG